MPSDNDDGGGGFICNEGEIEDCDGNCFEETFLEDGICNDGFDDGPNFNCSSLYFDGDCLNNFENCNPDCPVGILEFGSITVNLDMITIITITNMRNMIY